MLLLPPYSSPLYFRDVMCLVSVSQVLLDMYYMDMLAVSLWIFILSFLLVQAEGVYNQRLQNLALTLDKVGAFHFSEESPLSSCFSFLY